MNTRLRDFLATNLSLPQSTDLTTMLTAYLKVQTGDMNGRWKALLALV